MPRFQAKLSDGRTVLFEADEQPTEDDILGAVTQHETLAKGIEASTRTAGDVLRNIASPAAAMASQMGRAQIEKPKLQRQQREAQVAGDIAASEAASAGVGEQVAEFARTFPQRAVKAPFELAQAAGIPIGKPTLSPDDIAYLRSKYAELQSPLTPPQQAGPKEQAITDWLNEQASGMTSPEMVAAVGTPMAAKLAKMSPEAIQAAGRVIARGFQAQMASGVPEAVQATVEAPDTPSRIKAGLSATAAVGLPLAIEAGLTKPTPKIPDYPGSRIQSPERGVVTALGNEEMQAEAKKQAAMLELGRSVENVVPAIKTMSGEVVAGEKGQSHNDIIEQNKIPAKEVDRREFVDTATGQEVSREKLATAIPAKKEGEAHSSDLAKAQEAMTPPAMTVGGEFFSRSNLVRDKETIGEWNEVHAKKLEGYPYPNKEFYEIWPSTVAQIRDMSDEALLSNFRESLRAIREVSSQGAANTKDATLDAKYRLDAAEMYRELRRRQISPETRVVEEYLGKTLLPANYELKTGEIAPKPKTTEPPPTPAPVKAEPSAPPPRAQPKGETGGKKWKPEAGSRAKWQKSLEDAEATLKRGTWGDGKPIDERGKQYLQKEIAEYRRMLAEHPEEEPPVTTKATGYTVYEKPDPTSPNGKRYIVAGPDDHGIKLSAKSSGWKVVGRNLERDKAFAEQKKRNEAFMSLTEFANQKLGLAGVKSSQIGPSIRAQYKQRKAEFAAETLKAQESQNRFKLRTLGTQGVVEGEGAQFTLIASTREEPNGTHSVSQIMAIVPPGILTSDVAPRVTIDLSEKIFGKTPREARVKAYQSLTDEINKGNFEIFKQAQETKALPPPTPPPVEQKEVEPEKGPGMVGMGGALLGEVGTGYGADIYGIAERVRAERAKAGQVEPVEPGQGVAAEAQVIRGRELIAAGANPDQILSQFEQTKRLSSDDMAVVRAHGEELAKAASNIEIKFGTETPEYLMAHKALSDWDRRSKAMQTEWHKTGMAQQGETDIDTGTFTGLQRAYEESTGKQFTPDQAKKAKVIADKSAKANIAAEEAKAKLNEELKKEPPVSPKVKSLADRVIASLDRSAESALMRIKKRRAEGRLFTGIPVEEMTDYAIYGASKFAKGAIEFGKWSEEMIKDIGDFIKPHLKEIWDAADKRLDFEVKRLAPGEDGEVIKARIKTGAGGIAKAERRAFDAAKKTVRENAIRLAKLDAKKRVAKTAGEMERLGVQEKQAKDALEAANKTVKEHAAKVAETERKLQGDPMLRVWNRANVYLEKGLDNFDDIRNKVATDLGMSVKQVTRLMAQSPRVKYLADEVWRSQQQARRLKEQARRWVNNLSTPGYVRAIQMIPRAMFGLKVGFHGTVALGTHAPMVAFQPKFWSTYVQNFGRMYKLVGWPYPGGQRAAKAYYEKQVQELMRDRPGHNYTTARRAGLVNDPFVYEDYNSPDTAKYFGNLTGMGNRGYTVLKILRQDMFDQMWNNLPKTSQIPEVAEAIADGLNHATGVVKGRAPAGTNIALFAPRLEASRVMWLAGDPIKMLNTFANWDNASLGDKTFAMNQLKEKAWVFGTLAAMLTLNQGFLTATGSKQKINGVPKVLGGRGLDPMESDFLKFKAAGLEASYGSAMLNMAKLPARMATSIMFHGKTSKLILEDERVYKIAGDYIRSQLSPFAGTATDLALGRDYAGRPLPRALFGTIPGPKDIPKRLRMHGVTKPYTWGEYSSIQFTPIPISEGIREVWGQGLGMSDQQIDHYLKAWAIISIMAGTGGRVTEDRQLKK